MHTEVPWQPYDVLNEQYLRVGQTIEASSRMLPVENKNENKNKIKTTKKQTKTKQTNKVKQNKQTNEYSNKNKQKNNNNKVCWFAI
jgi:hypothetical protein